MLDAFWADQMTLVGAVATHYFTLIHIVEARLSASSTCRESWSYREAQDVPVHVHVDEVSWILERTGVDSSALLAHHDGEVL